MSKALKKFVLKDSRRYLSSIIEFYARDQNDHQLFFLKIVDKNEAKFVKRLWRDTLVNGSF